MSYHAYKIKSAIEILLSFSFVSTPQEMLLAEQTQDEAPKSQLGDAGDAGDGDGFRVQGVGASNSKFCAGFSGVVRVGPATGMLYVSLSHSIVCAGLGRKDAQASQMQNRSKT